MPKISDAFRASTTAMLDDIVRIEKDLNARGFEISDPDEWQQLGDIVKRLERKWGLGDDREAAE